MNTIFIKLKSVAFSIVKFLNAKLNYYIGLNFFQSLAIVHLFAIVFILMSLISLVSLYFGESIIAKFNIEEKYPKINKYIQKRIKYKVFYLKKDIIIISIILILLAILNLMLFISFS